MANFFSVSYVPNNKIFYRIIILFNCVFYKNLQIADFYLSLLGAKMNIKVGEIEIDFVIVFIYRLRYDFV